jgi:hypothetical protein
MMKEQIESEEFKAEETKHWSNEIGCADLEKVSGGRRGNEDDDLKDLEIQR